MIDRDLAIATLVFALFNGAFLYLVQLELFGAHFWSLPSGYMLRDFGFFWGGARLALFGNAGAVFDPHQFNAWLAGQIAPGTMEPFATWSYPPTMLLPLLPFGLPKPSVALALWLAGSFGLLAFVLGSVFREARLVLAIVLSPAALYCISFGQNGALTAALLIAGFWVTDRRPAFAGFCLGLLTIKPQVAVLVPFALASGGHWRAFASAVVTAAAMIALTIILFGIGAWSGFLHNTMPHMSAQLLHDYGIPPQYAMPTMLVTLQGWRVPTTLACYGQGLSTLFAIGAVVWAWRRAETNRDWRNALTCAAASLATPFSYVYDVIPSMLAVALVARKGLQDGFWWPERPALVLAWVWPAISIAWTHVFGLAPIGAFATLALVLCLISRIAEGRGTALATLAQPRSAV